MHTILFPIEHTEQNHESKRTIGKLTKGNLVSKFATIFLLEDAREGNVRALTGHKGLDYLTYARGVVEAMKYGHPEAAKALMPNTRLDFILNFPDAQFISEKIVTTYCDFLADAVKNASQEQLNKLFDNLNAFSSGYTRDGLELEHARARAQIVDRTLVLLEGTECQKKLQSVLNNA